jgi:exodeoxyribonuclease VII small subunit
MAKKQDELKDLSFEDAIERVEALIDRMESGEIGLEESIGQYEQGTKLLSHCRAILERAEQRIAKLAADDSGQLKDAGQIPEAGAE